MKKILMIIIILLLFSVMVSAKLSEETLDMVKELRLKHYGYSCIDSNILSYLPFEYEWVSIHFDNGILFVETQDGKWFIEMKEIIEGR